MNQVKANWTLGFRRAGSVKLQIQMWVSSMRRIQRNASHSLRPPAGETMSPTISTAPAIDPSQAALSRVGGGFISATETPRLVTRIGTRV